jgi:hypothetical protein
VNTEAFMEIDLRLNDVGFTLGEKLDAGKLASAKCEKLGFLARLQIRAKSGESVYWATNCDIRCFGDEFRLFANLDWEDGADLMVGTFAYLYFGKAGLGRIAFEVLEDHVAAIAATEGFQRLCERAFGAPVSRSPECWNDGRHVISCSLVNTGTRALFEWTARQSETTQMG